MGRVKGHNAHEELGRVPGDLSCLRRYDALLCWSLRGRLGHQRGASPSERGQGRPSLSLTFAVLC